MKRRRQIFFLSAYLLAGVTVHQLLFEGATVPAAGYISGIVAQEVDRRVLHVRQPEESSSIFRVQYGDLTRRYDIYRFEDPHFKPQRDTFLTIVIVPHDKSRPALIYSPQEFKSEILFSESGEDEIRRCLSREGYPVLDYHSGHMYAPLDMYIPNEAIDRSTDGSVWHGRDPREMTQRSKDFTPEAARHYGSGSNQVLVMLAEDKVNRIRRIATRNWHRGDLR